MRGGKYMDNLIKKITEGKEIDKICAYVIDSIYKNGPVSISDMEILSYLSLYQPEKFALIEKSLLKYMALFYKNKLHNEELLSLKDLVFVQYRNYINETFKIGYTPIQANIVKSVKDHNYFSFSAPTSTGKSFVFLDLIQQSQHDVIVIVPSRALINEYFVKLCDQIKDHSVNILTVIDKINTANAKRNVFIVTPERCRELFKYKDYFFVDLFLFDEAQLSNEDSKRGLYFDSIVRRSKNAFPNAKYVFSHPFVKNPESQIEKNHFSKERSFSVQYNQKNVGQLFLNMNKKREFYHFGINKIIMGGNAIKCEFDPIKKVINNGGAILVYTTKTSIYKKRYRNQFKEYIDLCEEIINDEIDVYMNQIKSYTGGGTEIDKNYYSEMITLMRRGIVIHHGSLPLKVRITIEQFTRAGFCRICFATSTLEQGVNMPFDLVFIDRLEASKPLSVKNIIGRAGRSTDNLKFDYGYIILNNKQISTFRRIINQEEILENISALDKENSVGDDYNDFKEAIKTGTYSDEFNLTEKELIALNSDDVDTIIKSILDSVFEDENLISLRKINEDFNNKLKLYSDFNLLYSKYLNRNLSEGECYVLQTAIKIILWRVHGKTFKNICWYRYSYASRTHERERSKGYIADNMEARYITEFSDLPNKILRPYNMFKGIKAKDVDYDRIVFDTYDYIDKLIGFKLNDIFYAAFIQFYDRNNDIRALKLAKYVRYGTANSRHIWMLRYGLTFEDIEILDHHIENINSEKIIFKNTIENVPDEQKRSVIRFL